MTGDNNQLLLFAAGHRRDVKLVYDQLKVRDSNRKSLPARATTMNLAPGFAQGTYYIRAVDQQQHVYITQVIVR